jgi:hypothetical protein
MDSITQTFSSIVTDDLASDLVRIETGIGPSSMEQRSGRLLPPTSPGRAPHTSRSAVHTGLGKVEMILDELKVASHFDAKWLLCLPRLLAIVLLKPSCQMMPAVTYLPLCCWPTSMQICDSNHPVRTNNQIDQSGARGRCIPWHIPAKKGVTPTPSLVTHAG